MLKLLTSLLLLHLIGNFGYAQTSLYTFSTIDIRKGLSNNKVNCIFKDTKGFMWFGTAAGLNRYDGYQFKVFKHNQSDSTSLSEDFVTGIFDGPNEKLWVTRRTGFAVFNPVTETFDRNANAVLSSFHMPNNSLNNIVRDKLGQYWFHLGDGSLYMLQLQQHKTIHVQSPILSSNYVTGISLAADGNIWCVFMGGRVEKINVNTVQVMKKSDALKNLGLSANAYFSVFADAQDDLWLNQKLAVPNGIYYLNTNKNTANHFFLESDVAKLDNNSVTGVVQSIDNSIWLSTDHGGINVIDKRDFSVTYLLNEDGKSGSLAQNSIVCLYKDKTGIIWAGTYKKGFSYYDKDKIAFPLFRHQPTDPHSLGYDDVNNFVEDKKGNIWIGTNGGGLAYFDRNNNHFTLQKHSDNNHNTIGNDVIVGMCMDHEQKLWIGSYFGGLDCYDGKTFIHYKNNKYDTNSLADDRVWEIFEDSKQNLWIGTLGGGVDRFDRDKKIFHHYQPSSFKGMRSIFINAIMEDKAGNIWVGGSDGIDVYDPSANTFINHFFYQNQQLGSLSNNNVISLFQDSRGLIWAGTRDGLNLFDATTNTFSLFRVENGLPSNCINTLIEDNEHQIWVGTPGGLSRVTVNVGESGKVGCHFANFDETDGLQGREFNENAVMKTSKGELVFGGANGFNLFLPANIKSSKTSPAIVLTDFLLFNKSVGIGEEVNGHEVLKQSISETKEIVLHSNQDVFSIEFAALDFSNNEKNRFAYTLQGFDKTWVETDGKTRKATYTNLDAGDYTFKVKASNGDGIWGKQELTMHIKVLPVFWKTIYAYLLYALLILGLLVFIRRSELKKNRKEFELEQERMQAKRMHELDLMKIKFFTNVSHEFRTPLSLILAPVEKMLQLSTTNTSLQMIQRNAKRLLNMVNQLLDFRKMEVQELKLAPSNGNIIHFIKELSFSFNDIAEKNNVHFSFNTSTDHFFTAFDHEKIERILFNLLSNAFKFTPSSGHVGVELELVRTTDNIQPTTKTDNSFSHTGQDSLGSYSFSIKVADTGIGIPPEKQERIFERFFQNEVPGSIMNQGSGIGLAITKEFVKLHGGSITVESEPDKGSCFVVTLPLVELWGNEKVDKQPLHAILLNSEPILALAENEMEKLALPQIENKSKKAIDKKPFVLLVEDNADFRFYLKENLGNQFSIIEAENGKEGWQKTLSCQPNLVVSDVSMPEMNGTDLCLKIKNDNRTSHIPVILLTALMGEEQQLKGLQTGASDYLTKPFNFEILVSKVSNLLAQQERAKKTYQKRVDANPVEVEVESADEKFMQQALEIIEKNIAEPDFSVEEMSRQMFMSRVSLYKRILSLTGKTPLEFIRHIRLKRAAQLLQKSQLTVAEVAYEVGFNNPKYFSKYFKLEFGLVPSAYGHDTVPLSQVQKRASAQNAVQDDIVDE